ncbi:MAG: LruC domain-containing protein [Trueperaceae bacterium]|nr:LruC domain-containing protein [Trueperaceae bacterium]
MNSNLFRRFFILTLLSVLLLLAACSSPSKSTPTPTPTDVNDLDVPSDFDYSTTQKVDLEITTEGFNGEGLANTLIEIYHSYDLSSEEPDYGSEVLKALTDENGQLSTTIEVPSYVDTLLVMISYLGLPPSAEISIAKGKASVHFAPAKRAQGNLQSFDTGIAPALSELQSAFTFSYNYLGSFNSQGVPNYATFEQPSSHLISLINTGLPEGKPVPQFHPSYIANSTETNIVLQESAEAWVTFLHEGAGYRNAIGYYYYDTNTPPAYRESIDTLTIIFPNGSFQGSGGGLIAGDKVQLKYKPGTAQESTIFPDGTTIGWFIVANGWNNTSVGQGYGIHLSNSELNYELNPSKQDHTVLLYDAVEDAFILGFEDIFREASWCDNDFNDAVYKVEVSPVTAMVTENIEPADTGDSSDSDSDGVTNTFDDYPGDSNKAFNNFYPGENKTGTLAFEDVWPVQGDYDFNDLVVDYNINQITNAQNKVVMLETEFTFRAAGAANSNAFAFELPIAPSKVASVSGQYFAGSGDHSYIPESPWIYLDLAANGTEKGQDKAVIFVVDDTAVFLGQMANTETGGTTVAPRKIKLSVTFTEPISLTTLGQPPYNPFLVSNIYAALQSACDCQERGVEIHLPGYAPTDLADLSLFNTGDDNSNLNTNSTYVSEDNLPWALHFPNRFEYPLEFTQITQAHYYFANWASSNGANTKDWYLDKPGYRNDNKLFDESVLPATVTFNE